VASCFLTWRVNILNYSPVWRVSLKNLFTPLSLLCRLNTKKSSLGPVFVLLSTLKQLLGFCFCIEIGGKRVTDSFYIYSPRLNFTRTWLSASLTLTE
jgi:hypothetical protein